MTICHQPDEDGEYTDEQFVAHLLHSTCSECASAGHRFMRLLEENKQLQQKNGVEKENVR